MKLRVGDKVRFVDEHLNKVLPTVYPVVGTVGEVTSTGVESIGYSVNFEDGKHIFVEPYMIALDKEET